MERGGGAAGTASVDVGDQAGTASVDADGRVFREDEDLSELQASGGFFGMWGGSAEQGPDEKDEFVAPEGGGAAPAETGADDADGAADVEPEKDGGVEPAPYEGGGMFGSLFSSEPEPPKELVAGNEAHDFLFYDENAVESSAAEGEAVAGEDLVTRDRTAHHPTEIPQIFTHFSHMSCACTTTMFAYTDWDALYHTQTCRTSDEM